MSKDWQIGSGYVKEPKIVKDPWSTKSGYSQAKEITPPNIHESQTVTVCDSVGLVASITFASP